MKTLKLIQQQTGSTRRRRPLRRPERLTFVSTPSSSLGISEIVTNENQRNQARTKRMQASWAVGVGKSEVWAIGGLFHMTGEAVESGRGALKSVQTVSLRSLPVARLAAATLAFHGLIRSRLGRLGAWPRTCRTLVSIRRCSDQTAATTNVNGRTSGVAGSLASPPATLRVARARVEDNDG